MKRAALHTSQYVPSDQGSLPSYEPDGDDVGEGPEEDQDQMELEDDDSSENSLGSQPDLEDYFSNWDIPPKDVVAICRAYASYVAAQTGCMRTKKD